MVSSVIYLAAAAIAFAGPTPQRQTAIAHWAFQPVTKPSLPTVRDQNWVKTSVDPFILAKLEARGIRPASLADKHTLIRRATYDLTGLPPTPDEVEAFAHDQSPDAFAKVIERLLDSPHYGEHWGRHWLDVVRYADTAGETADYPVSVAWRYRNYVIDAFNSDRAYDEFLREQVAGDILARDGPRERYAERVTATGYLAISRRFGFDSENYHHLTIQDTIDTLGQSILGLSLGCARCHDHKYDPISMTDYYGLYGIFDSSRYAFPGSEQKQKYRALVPVQPPEESQPKWREFDTRVAAFMGKLEKSKQPIPAAVLRSLDDLDGDFEMQAIAAGGSKGVLVPPWISEGTIAVTKEAQSPFKNLHALGKVGVNVPAGTNAYGIAQALYPKRTRDNCRMLCLNLDFRIATNAATAQGMHRLWIGACTASPSVASATDGAPDNSGPSSTPTAAARTGSFRESPAVEVFISSRSVSIRVGESVETIRAPQPNRWQNLQLTLDLKSHTVAGKIGAPEDMVTFVNKPLSPTWTGTIDFVSIDSRGPTDGAFPALELDNLAVQESPVAPVTDTALAGIASADHQEDKSEIEKTKQELSALLAEGPCELAYAVVEGTPRNARLHIRGESDKPGAEVQRGFIKALGGGALPPDASGSGRLELAQWLTRPDNPLTARVMVNRIWQYHFGRGLVKTPNDFGTRGQPPTHPELLDYLAAEFVKSGWSVKAMHRLLMLSATYQQGSSESVISKSVISESVNGESVINKSVINGGTGVSLRKSASLITDPLITDYFSPFPRRRLTAEELRDSILFVSGELDLAPARGHPFPTPTGWGYTQHNPFSAVYDHNRRSVYLMMQRLKRHPFLALFDGADPNASTPERGTTTVPTQALFFLNDAFVHAKAEKFAARLQRLDADEAQCIERAYRLAIGRSPTKTERTEATEFLASYKSELGAVNKENVEATALAAFARALFGSNEFLHLD